MLISEEKNWNLSLPNLDFEPSIITKSGSAKDHEKNTYLARQTFLKL